MGAVGRCKTCAPRRAGLDADRGGSRKRPVAEAESPNRQRLFPRCGRTSSAGGLEQISPPRHDVLRHWRQHWILLDVGRASWDHPGASLRSKPTLKLRTAYARTLPATECHGLLWSKRPRGVNRAKWGSRETILLSRRIAGWGTWTPKRWLKIQFRYTL